MLDIFGEVAMQKIFRCFGLLLLAIFFLKNSAAAVVHLEDQQSNEKNIPLSSSQAWVSDTALRVDATEKGHDLSYIYLRPEQMLYIVDHKTKTYRQVDQAKLQAEHAKGYDIVPMQFTRFGEYINMDTKQCKFYNGLKLDHKQADVWTADPRQLGISSDAYKTMQASRQFLQAYASEAAAFFHAGSRQWETDKGYSGVPVKTVTYGKKGNLARSIELSKIEQVDVNDDFFALPQGYKKAL